MYIGIIILTGLLFYLKTMKYGYVIDDENVAMKEGTGKWYKDFWLEIRGTSHPSGELAHILSTAVHIVVSCLIYLVFGKNNISFLASMLFLLNPANNQGSIWVSGRPYSISALLILLGLLLKPIFPLFYVIANLSSINSIFAPMLFLFIKPIWFSLFTAFGLWYFSKRYLNTIKNRDKSGTEYMRIINWKRLIIVLKTYGYYFRLAIFPIKIAFCHEYLHTYGMSEKETNQWYKLDKYFWIGLGLLAFIIYGIFNKLPIYGLIWYSIFIAQWCNFILVTHPIAERYLYIANIGLMFQLALLLFYFPALAFGLLVFYATKLYYFMPCYRLHLDFFKQNTDEFPGVAMGWNQLGLENFKFGNHGSAIDAWIRGVQIRPEDFRINYNLANVLTGLGQYDKAMHFLEVAEKHMNKNDNPKMWEEQIESIRQHCIKNGWKPKEKQNANELCRTAN